MLQLSKSLLNVPVMSLRLGGQVATAVEPIINPNNLKIEGWHCTDSKSKDQLILLSQDIREILPQGFVVNDFEVLAHPDDLVRLQDVLKLDFPLLGHSVVSDKKRKLGKVSDFATETTTFYIQKLYTSQSMLTNLKGSGTAIARDQIIEINNRAIVVKDPLQPVVAQDQLTAQPQVPAQPLPAPATPIQ